MMPTHQDLVARAERWLRRRGHRTVLTRGSIFVWEHPDALGFTSAGHSTLIECKTSRADFLRDRKKHCRRFPSTGMGQTRYYLTPPGLVRLTELPERWGLLEAVSRRVLRLVRKAEPMAAWNVHQEQRLLLARYRWLEIVLQGPQGTNAIMANLSI